MPIPISRETSEKLEIYKKNLLHWNKTINLVGKDVEAHLETHIEEAIAMASLFPLARYWADFGSGSGLPGLPLSFCLSPSGSIDLVESDHRKCAFLREVARQTGASAHIRAIRLENYVADQLSQTHFTLEIVTAKALSRLEQLIVWTYPLIQRGAIGLFPKGPKVFEEMADISEKFLLKYDLIPNPVREGHYFVRVAYGGRGGGSQQK